MKKLLENNTILLRAPEPEDLDALYTWENDTDLWVLGASITPFSRYTLREYLTTSTQDIYTDKQLRMMVELKQSSELIGTVDLYDFDPFHRRAGVGILIDPKFQKRGLGLQALELLEAYAFDFLKLQQLYALVPEKNTASIRLFNKAKYALAGKLTDWISANNGFENAQLLQKINMNRDSR